MDLWAQMNRSPGVPVLNSPPHTYIKDPPLPFILNIPQKRPCILGDMLDIWGGRRVQYRYKTNIALKVLDHVGFQGLE